MKKNDKQNIYPNGKSNWSVNFCISHIIPTREMHFDLDDSWGYFLEGVVEWWYEGECLRDDIKTYDNNSMHGVKVNFVYFDWLIKQE